MNKIFFQSTALLLSLAAITGVSSPSPVGAQTVDASATGGASDSATSLFPNQPLEFEPSNLQFAEAPTQIDNLVPLEPLAPAAIASDATAKNQPVPGTSHTSVSALFDRPATVESSEVATKSDGSTVAQAEFDPGRSTRSGSSYVGAGGNIGIGGDTAIGEFGFAIFSKIGLTNRFSVRPAIVFSGDTDILIPVTYDFAIQAEPFERINFAPYVGAGAIITTDGDSNIGLLLTGGVDLPLSEQFTATAGLNFGFNTDTVGVGLIVGVGYNFGAGFQF